MMQNIRLKKCYLNIITGLAIIFSIIMAVIRDCYGIEITDEAFYVAEAISILRGNAPLTFTMSDKPFFPILLAGCIRVYQIFEPELGGVFLFSRIMFIVFRFGITAMIYVLLRKEFNRNYLVFALCLLFTIWGESIPNLSYNTISCWLSIFAGVIVFRSMITREEKKSFFLAGLSGMIISLGVLAHFGQLLNAVWFGGVYLIFEKGKRRWKNFIIYVLGGVGTLVVVLFRFSFQYGWNKFIFGVETAFGDINRITGPSFHDNLRHTISSTKAISFIFGIILLVMLLYRMICLKQRKVCHIKFEDAVLVAVFISMLYIGYFNEPRGILLKVGTVGGMILLTCAIAAITNENRKTIQIIVTIMAFPVTYVIICGFFLNTMAYGRFWMFDFVLFGGVLLFEKYYIHGGIMRKSLCLLTYVLTFFILFSSEWGYLYREKSLAELDTKVVEGVYKGIITTESKVEDTQALERYIREVTSQGDRVLFLDNVPAAYMMTDAIPWAPSTWDLTAYSYGFNNSTILYRYFENREEFPTKIIYVDYGRDEKMSIDSENYQFNEFVKKNYQFIEKRFFGDTYEIRLYER